MLVLGAHTILEIFGSVYARDGSGPLRILALGILPTILRSHYLTLCRITNRMRMATLVLAASSLVQLVLAGLGALVAGLAGLSVGVTLVFYLETFVTAPLVFREARG